MEGQPSVSRATDILRALYAGPDVLVLTFGVKPCWGGTAHTVTRVFGYSSNLWDTFRPTHAQTHGLIPGLKPEGQNIQLLVFSKYIFASIVLESPSWVEQSSWTEGRGDWPEAISIVTFAVTTKCLFGTTQNSETNRIGSMWTAWWLSHRPRGHLTKDCCSYYSNFTGLELIYLT